MDLKYDQCYEFYVSDDIKAILIVKNLKNLDSNNYKTKKEDIYKSPYKVL